MRRLREADAGGEGNESCAGCAYGRDQVCGCGANESKVRVISSGGISCGLDATLYLVSQRLGKDTAVSVAEMMEYAWREA